MVTFPGVHRSSDRDPIGVVADQREVGLRPAVRETGGDDLAVRLDRDRASIVDARQDRRRRRAGRPVRSVERSLGVGRPDRHDPGREQHNAQHACAQERPPPTKADPAASLPVPSPMPPRPQDRTGQPNHRRRGRMAVKRRHSSRREPIIGPISPRSDPELSPQPEVRERTPPNKSLRRG